MQINLLLHHRCYGCCSGVGIGKNVNICGTLTVAGESTFNSKINVNGNIDIRDDDKILLGDDDDFEIFHIMDPMVFTYFKNKNTTGGTIFLTKHFIGRNSRILNLLLMLSKMVE